MRKNIVIFGCHGGIGKAFLDNIQQRYPEAFLHLISSKPMQQEIIATKPSHRVAHMVNYTDEASIKHISDHVGQSGKVDMVLVATGILHGPDFKPEKNLRELDMANFQKLFLANSIFPAMVVKYFIPLLNKEEQSVFAVLSARVGSISDNQLGGWYAYRASKAALNMIIKTTAIEVARSHKKAVIVGLHPGTVDSALSKPFIKNVATEKIFTPNHAAAKLLDVIEKLDRGDSGKCFAWDGVEIMP